MMYLLSGAGLRYNERAIAAGAQTERRGEAWAGEGLAWRQNLTGRFFLVVSSPLTAGDAIHRSRLTAVGQKHRSGSLSAAQVEEGRRGVRGDGAVREAAAGRADEFHRARAAVVPHHRAAIPAPSPTAT
jgi:hypothetical protein